MVAACEKALRQISEILYEDGTVKSEASDGDDDDDTEAVNNTTTSNGTNATTNNNTKKTVPTSERALSGAMRVGPLANGLLLHGDLVVSLVLLCSKWPTFSLMRKVIDKLPAKLKVTADR